MSLEIKEGAVTNRHTSGPTLFRRTVRPKGARLGVAIVPGYFEHGGRYAHLQEAWGERAIASIALDVRGHGRAEGPRGVCRRFEEYVDDVSELEPIFDAEFGDLPVALFGHSFGGLIASRVAALRPWRYRALMMTSPYFMLAMPVPVLKRWVGEVASRIAPGLCLPAGVTGAQVTRDAERARAHDADALGFDTVNARWFTEITRAQSEALASSPSMKLPLYVALGTADSLANPEGGRSFFAAYGSTEKVLREWPGYFHEVFNEPEWRDPADEMAMWALSLLNRPT